MRPQRKHTHGHVHDVGALRRPGQPSGQTNPLRFFVRVEGELEFDGHVRAANGARWRVA